MLEVGPEDYLTHYFRSNGLPLDGQRPQKNKYAMAFEWFSSIWIYDKSGVLFWLISEILR